MRRSLVLLHGWGYTPRLWDALCAELNGFDVHKPWLHPLYENLADWSDVLAPTLPDQGIVLGWSLGAMLALSLAARHPAKVRGLFLIAASPRFIAAPDWPYGLQASVVDTFRANFKQSPNRIMQRFLALQILGDAQRTFLSPTLEAAQDKSDTHIRTLDRGLQILTETDLRGLTLPDEIPLQLVHGQHDAVMPVGAAKWLQARGGNVQLQIQEDAGHAPLLAQPAKLAQMIRTFAYAL